jgi:hypothetical protein
MVRRRVTSPRPDDEDFRVHLHQAGTKTLVGDYGLVGEKQSTPLAVPDHDLNGIEQVTSRHVGIAEFARSLQVVPGNLEGVLDQSWQPLNHAGPTPSGPPRSL